MNDIIEAFKMFGFKEIRREDLFRDDITFVELTEYMERGKPARFFIR